MTIVTDHVQVKNGPDFTFICGKVPFAITCSSRLQHGNYNLIDMDLVNKMKIPQIIKRFILKVMDRRIMICMKTLKRNTNLNKLQAETKVQE